MIVIDSCGWLEWFTDGPLAGTYREHLGEQEDIIVPAIVLFEVYKILKREVGEEKALLAASYMKNLTLVPLDETLALAAADIALREKLAMADAIVMATAMAHNAAVITSDADLKEQNNVKFIPKKF